MAEILFTGKFIKGLSLIKTVVGMVMEQQYELRVSETMWLLPQRSENN